MKILAYPKDKNPYQELLYTEMRKLGDIIYYLSPTTSSETLNLLLFLPKIIALRFRGFNIFHLHWTYAFLPSASFWHTHFGRRVAYGHYNFLLFFLCLLGFRIVWTAHNVLPHESIFLDDVKARKKLVEQSRLVIAHSKSTRDEILNKIRLDEAIDKIRIIPHGSYVGVYPVGISRTESRKKLHVQDADFIFLYLGQIRKYKGVDFLLDVFGLLDQRKNVRLVIAGECMDSTIKSRIESLLDSGRILFFEGRIPDDELQVFFSAADVVVLPFMSVATSGSALLALSFGKSIIVPDIGDVASLPEDIAYKYVSGDKKLLLRVLEQAIDNQNLLSTRDIYAYQYAEKLSWREIALRTHRSFEEIL